MTSRRILSELYSTMTLAGIAVKRTTDARLQVAVVSTFVRRAFHSRQFFRLLALTKDSLLCVCVGIFSTSVCYTEHTHSLAAIAFFYLSGHISVFFFSQASVSDFVFVHLHPQFLSFAFRSPLSYQTTTNLLADIFVHFYKHSFSSSVQALMFFLYLLSSVFEYH